MKEQKTKGTWGLRLLVRLFTIAMGVLVFWLFGFLIEDIESIPGPDYATIERKYANPSLEQKRDAILKQASDWDQELSAKRDQQRMVGDSSANLQRTINQLLELQKLSIQKDVSLPESEKGNLSASLARFLESQKSYQDLNQAITELTAKKLVLNQESIQIEQQLTKLKEPAQKEFEHLSEMHRLRLALYQLLIIVPLLLIAGYLLAKKRGSLYFPLFLAFGCATLLKVGLVVHEYFPSQYFKYVLILALLGVVARLLVHFIRTAAFPKLDWLMLKRREAYERFLCPVCDYPIRTGPRRFLYWTRRTVHKILPQAGSDDKAAPYACPACGTRLFEDCASCHVIRHSMLAYCEHCGAEKEMK